MFRKRTSPSERTNLSESSGTGRKPRAPQPDDSEDLPYAVELWTLDRSGIERVLARANGPTLAYAIFAAAEVEHLGRRISLRHGDQVIAVRN